MRIGCTSVRLVLSGNFSRASPLTGKLEQPKHLGRIGSLGQVLDSNQEPGSLGPPGSVSGRLALVLGRLVW